MFILLLDTFEFLIVKKKVSKQDEEHFAIH